MSTSNVASDRAGAALWLGFACLWLLGAAIPLLPPALSGLPATILATLALAAAAFAAIYGLSHLRASPLDEAISCAALAAGWWFVSGHSATGPAGALAASTANCLLLAACGFFGRIISRVVREAKLVPPALAALAIADLYTVAAGPTHLALEKAPEVVRKVSVAVPQAGSAAKPGARLQIAATIGPGDFIFLAFVASAAARTGLPAAPMVLGAGLAASAAMAATLALSLPPIPLLPAIALGAAIPILGRVRYTRQEKLSLAIGALALLALLAALHFALIRAG